MADDDLDFGQTVKGFAQAQRVYDRYRLEHILGRGGMGVVWLAFDEKLERRVALKFLPGMVTADAVAIDDLKRETRRCLDLTHPNIVRIYDFVDDDESAAIAMEYIDGQTLSSLRVERPNRVFEVEDVRPWMLAVCDALAYAHEQAEVVHRDLKPANIMLDGRGRVKIADFGISSSISESVSRVSVVKRSGGTLVYMSPQQAMGEMPTVEDDIYALGATIYDLLTGKPPFYSGDVLAQVRERVPVSMTERRTQLGVADAKPIPPEWESVVAECLAKDPAQRPPGARALGARLRGAPAAPPPKPALPAGAPPRPSGRAGVLIALAVILLLCGAGAGVYFGVIAPAEKKRQEAENLARLDRQNELARLESERQEIEKKRAASARGSLQVDSEPQGAMVRVGDTAKGITPAAFSNLVPGEYKVRIEKDGYEPAEATATVKENDLAVVGPIALRAVATPTPEPAPEPAATATPEPTPDPAAEKMASFKEFFAAMWQHQTSNDPAVSAADYADEVRYCYKDDGPASRAFIEQDIAKLIRSYPVRNYEMISMDTPQLSGDDAEVSYRFRYSYSGSKPASGVSNVTLTAHWNGERWEIVAFDENVERGASGTATPAPASGNSSLSEEEQRIVATFQDFLKKMWEHQSSNDPAAWAGDFADTVRYGYADGGVASRAFIEEDRRKLVQRYPTRSYEWLGIDGLSGGGGTISGVIHYRYRYSGAKQASGKVAVSFTAKWNGAEWQFTSYDESVQRQ